jgi:hypothetical protein
MELGRFAANVFGSGMLVGQELAWDEQRVASNCLFIKELW